MGHPSDLGVDKMGNNMCCTACGGINPQASDKPPAHCAPPNAAKAPAPAAKSSAVGKENDAKLAKAGFAEKLVYKQADKGQQPEAKPGKESLAEKLCVNVHAMPDALSGACADSC